MSLRAGTASFIFACLVCGQVTAQSSASSSTSPERISSLFNKSPVDRLVDRLIENAALFHATLPSITAREMIESGVTGNGPFHRHATAEATMRVVRKTPDQSLEESREFIAVNGKPVAPGKHVSLPTDLMGGFLGSMAFFTSASRHCFHYALAQGEATESVVELHITFSTDAASLSDCPVGMEGMSGIARIDSKTHQLTHLERSIPYKAAVSMHRWPISSVDLAPVALGDKTFWLPVTVIGRSIDGKAQLEWVSHYSDFHRFTATTNILPLTP